MMYHLLLCFTVLIGHPQEDHNPVVAELKIEESDNLVYVTAILEKENLVRALLSEAKCTPKDMISICAGEYVRHHFKLTVNGNESTYTKTEQRMEQDAMVIVYQLDKTEDIKSVELNSTYLISSDSHAIINAKIDVKDQTKRYQLSASRPAIAAYF